MPIWGPSNPNNVTTPDKGASSVPLDLTVLNNAAVIALGDGRGSIGASVTGLTSSGAVLTIEGSFDGGASYVTAAGETPSTGAKLTTLNTNQSFRINGSGFSHLRLRVSTAGTGTATVGYNASTSAGVVDLGNPIPAGSNVIGKVGVQVSGNDVSASNPVPMLDAFQAPVTATWNSATAINTTFSANTAGYDTVVFTVVAGTVSSGAITFEVYDGANWIPVKSPRTDSYITDSVYTIGSGATRAWQIPVAGFPQFRARLSSVITGAGSVGLTLIASSAPDTSIVTVGIDPTSPLGRTAQVTVNPTVSTTAYSAGTIVGGLLTFANAFVGNSGLLQSVTIKNKTVQTAGYKLYLFSQQPTNSTWTDKATPAVNVNDLPYLLGEWGVSTADSGLGTMTVYRSDGIGAALVAANTNLYGILVTTGTPTFGSASDLSVTLSILPD